jgi:hypothetical protein
LTTAALVEPASVVQRTRPVDFTPLDDDWLALDAEAAYCYSLNEVAMRIWRLIEQPISVSAICTELLRHYAVDAATCQADVLAVLNELVRAGLASAVGGARA